MREISTIQGSVWAIREITKYPLMRSGGAFNYAFYDPKSGEVWATRVVIGAERTTWVYTPRPKDTMDITIPWEWNEDCVPEGLLCAILIGKRYQLMFN